MDPVTPASFIPKRSLTAESRAGGAGLFFLISLLLFVLSLAAAGAAFAYNQYLETAIESKKTSLQRSEGAYDINAIQDLVRIDSRLGRAKVLMQKHVAPSAIFGLLSELALEQVQFTGFEYTLGNDGSAEIALTGIADSFSTVALQSDQFGSSRALRDVIFSDIKIDQNGGVDFSVHATVDPSVISYAKVLAGAPGIPVIPAPQNEVPAGATSTPTL